MAEELLRMIIGDIASNPNYGLVMKKWREMFSLKQGEVSDKLGAKQSVISDYENERCKNPGIKFIRDYSLAIIKLAKEKNPKQYANLLKRLKIKESEELIEKIVFKKDYTNYDLMKSLKASQLVMPSNELKVKTCAFFLDKVSKLITKRPSYNVLKSMGSQEGAMFVFLNVKSGNLPVILINFLIGKGAKNSVLLFSSDKLKLSWLAKRLAKSNNLSILWTKKDKEELLSSLKKL
jgi:predicted transcriptional regulator